MESSAEADYAAFEEKVNRTIYLDNLSHQVTKAVLENALVEMKSVKQAEDIINEMGDSPFMISGMPRPVRAQKAQMEMFDDRPKKHRKRIICNWMDPSLPSFEVAKKFKNMTKRHAAEASYLMELQLADEEKLHNQQDETLKANYKKYELIDGAQAGGTIKRLAAFYEKHG